MDRRIEFRGRHHTSGEWCYGQFAVYDDEYFIITPDGDSHMVEPDTVGQYVCDSRGGKPIWEGDIIETDYNLAAPFGAMTGPFYDGFIQWSEVHAAWMIRSGALTTPLGDLISNKWGIVVTGTIYDRRDA